MVPGIRHLVDFQERMEADTKSRVQAIMDGKSKDYNRSRSQMKRNPLDETSNQPGIVSQATMIDDGLFAEKFSRIKFRDYQGDTR
jgi:hypothetical protein